MAARRAATTARSAAGPEVHRRLVDRHARRPVVKMSQEDHKSLSRHHPGPVYLRSADELDRAEVDSGDGDSSGCTDWSCITSWFTRVSRPACRRDRERCSRFRPTATCSNLIRRRRQPLLRQGRSRRLRHRQLRLRRLLRAELPGLVQPVLRAAPAAAPPPRARRSHRLERTGNENADD